MTHLRESVEMKVASASSKWRVPLQVSANRAQRSTWLVSKIGSVLDLSSVGKSEHLPLPPLTSGPWE